MNWLKEHWFKLGCLICGFIVALSAGYYYVIFLPQEAHIKAQVPAEEVETEKEKPVVEQKRQAVPESSALKMERCQAQAKIDGKEAFDATMDEQITCELRANGDSEYAACLHEQWAGAVPYGEFQEQEEYDRSYAKCLSS